MELDKEKCISGVLINSFSYIWDNDPLHPYWTTFELNDVFFPNEYLTREEIDIEKLPLTNLKRVNLLLTPDAESYGLSLEFPYYLAGSLQKNLENKVEDVKTVLDEINIGDRIFLQIVVPEEDHKKVEVIGLIYEKS